MKAAMTVDNGEVGVTASVDSAWGGDAGAGAGAGAGERRLWAVLLLARTVQEFFKQCMFIIAFSFINNCAPIEQRGLVNGVAIAMASVAKGFGPAVGGSVYAWTMGNGLGYPFDVHGVWILMAVVYVVTLGISWRIPESIVRSKEAAAEEEATGLELTAVPGGQTRAAL
jgi:MFS family permease